MNTTGGEGGRRGEGVQYKPDKIVGFGQRCHDPDKDAVYIPSDFSSELQ